MAVLLAAGIPFAAFTYFVVREAQLSITESNAEFFLRNKARDVADKIDLWLQERRRDLLLWSTEPTAIAALRNPGDENLKRELRRTLDIFCRLKVVYDLLMVIDTGGRIVASNEHDSQGSAVTATIRKRLAGADLYDEPWFRRALRGERPGIDWHRDPLQIEDVSLNSENPSDYSVGFAAPIYDPDSDEILGVWYSLVDWSSIQSGILDSVQSGFQEMAGRKSPQYASGYAFVWDSDAARILGHADRQLYGRRVDEPPVGLPRLRRAVLENPTGVLHYDYPEGKQKRAAFQPTLPSEDGGFGWIVGVGVEDEQIFAPVRFVGTILTVGVALGAAGLVLCVFVVSRTVTRPLRALSDGARKLAQGNLSARVSPSGPAETVTLATTFNQMAEELERSREQAIRAEKEAAWREMARQVSHEIKNPLTPMKLSIQLLDKAWRDHSPEFETILRRAVDTVDRQIESLRTIATDFRGFAGAPVRRRDPVLLGKLLDSVCALYSGVASERKLGIARRGGEAEILGDPDELQRAFVNLMDNAVHAAPEGSSIEVELERLGSRVRVRVRDEGAGIDPEIRGKLFTPYFSTRSQGTGLGLAIVRRIVEDHGGRAYLDDTVERGTALVVELPGLEAARPVAVSP